MFDLNAIVNAAIATAVAEAIKPLTERLAALESVCATQHNDMVTMRVRISALEAKTNEANMAEFVEKETLAAFAVTDIVGEERVAQIESRIAALEGVDHERQHAMTARWFDGARGEIDALTTRVVALENNPAQGVDTQAPQYTLLSKEQFKAMLHELATKDALVEYLDNQEWFWEKLSRKAGEVAEAAIEEHTSNYDHDEYDEHIGDDDKHFDGDIEDAIRDALSNMSFDISIR